MRSQNIEQFHHDPSINILLASLKCGGYGLNLTFASRVIMVEPWWNGGVERQAFSRVYRVGQKEETKMLRIYVNDTIDQRMLRLCEDKDDRIKGVIEDYEVQKWVCQIRIVWRYT